MGRVERKGKGKAFDIWLRQKNSGIQNHSTDQNNSTNTRSNALPIQSGTTSGSNALPLLREPSPPLHRLTKRHENCTQRI